MTPDAVLSWLGAAGIGAYLLHIRRRRTRSPLESKMLLLLLCLALLFTVRGFFWIVGGSALKIATFVPATLLPLAATLFVESLLRRHAPRGLKLFVLLGTVVFFAANLVVVESGRPLFFRSFSLFLVTTLVCLLLAVLTRDRDELSPAENELIDGVTVAILLAVPLALTDFRIRPAWLDLRLGGLGGLFFVFACVRLHRGRRLGLLRELVPIVLLAGALTASATLLVGRPSASTWAAAGSMGLGFVLLGSILERLRQQDLAEDDDSFRQWLLGADLGTLDAFVDCLDRLPLASRHLVLREGDPELRGYDMATMGGAFGDGTTVWTVAGLREAIASAAEDTMALEQLLDLLESCDMKQVTLLSRHPVRFLLLALPDVAAAREWLLDVALIHRLAISLEGERRPDARAAGA